MADNTLLMQDSVLEPVDLRLIHALQVSPRARWSALAPVVGVDPVTLARRWERLTEAGIAWVAGLPGPPLRGVTAMLEIRCGPATTVTLAEEIAQDAQAFTIDLTSGARDLLVMVTADDMSALSSYVMQRLAGLPAIRSTHTHLMSTVFTEAGQWRLRALSGTEVAAVRRGITVPRPGRARADAALEADLLRELAYDGRQGVSALTRRLGTGERRVREGLATMLASGRLVIRTDMAKTYSGWPVHAWYFLKVPAASINQVGASLSRINEIRLAVTAIGPYNLVLSVWMRSLADVQGLEVMIEDTLPGVTISDRSAVLRTVKNLGHLLDAAGRWTGQVVPVAALPTPRA